MNMSVPRASLIGMAALLVAGAFATGEAEARSKRGARKAPPAQSSSGCCPTCICGGLIAPTEAKRSQSGRPRPSQLRPDGVR